MFFFFGWDWGLGYNELTRQHHTKIQGGKNSEMQTLGKILSANLQTDQIGMEGNQHIDVLVSESKTEVKLLDLKVLYDYIIKSIKVKTYQLENNSMQPKLKSPLSLGVKIRLTFLWVAELSPFEEEP